MWLVPEDFNQQFCIVAEGGYASSQVDYFAKSS